MAVDKVNQSCFHGPVKVSTHHKNKLNGTYVYLQKYNYIPYSTFNISHYPN